MSCNLYYIPDLLVLLLIISVHRSAPHQLNLHLTEWTDDNENELVLQHNCLFLNHWENEENIHETTPYCLSEWPSKWIIEKNSLDQKYSFAQLFARNITSEDLYRWSAPLDIVENYQLYLNHVLTFTETEFYNCTEQTFGPKCQYSFDLMNSASSSSLSEIIHDFYWRDRKAPLGQTCYVHLQCDLGFSALCIRWDVICDGIVRCINGTDEEHCWQLEINECNENEFRCQNGQCIPRSFLAENNKAYECLDLTDELMKYMVSGIPYIVGPAYKLEGLLCGASFVHRRQAELDCQYECFNYNSMITPN